MAWTASEKANAVIPPTCLKMYKISDRVINFMKALNMELTVGEQLLQKGQFNEACSQETHSHHYLLKQC